MQRLIEWFTRNDVAANLLMAFIIVMGISALTSRIPIEVFPEIDLDIITINVPYRGATPAEVEEAVVIRIEEAIWDLQGIKEIVSIADEGRASISVEVEKGADTRYLLDEIKSRVDAITTFPENVEKPLISENQTQSNVISVVISGDLTDMQLRRLGETIRDDILILPGITQATLKATRPYEIAIEIPEAVLRRHQLTFDDVAAAIRRHSVDIPAGNLKTLGGEILLRTRGQAYTAEDYGRIPIKSHTDGTLLPLGEIALIRDGFEEAPLYARFNGKNAILIEIFRVGNQNALEIATTVKKYLELKQADMPPGIRLNYWLDYSRIARARLSTLVNSALTGGFLVFLTLSLFLRFSLAVWVCLGIPISFLGAIALMPYLGATINVISLFAFILVTGVVVDDAIVVGENVFTHLERKKDGLSAAIDGSKEVAIPVVFGVLTTVAAFVPLAMLEGDRGKLFFQIPVIVIPVLLFSLVETKLVLPAHLKHLKANPGHPPWMTPVVRFKNFFSDGLVWFGENIYGPVLHRALHNRYFTLALFLTVMILLAGLIGSGRIHFVYFPRVQSERATAQLVMPAGTPVEVTAGHIRHMETMAGRLKDKYRDPGTGHSIIENMLVTIGTPAFSGRRVAVSPGVSHLGGITFEITPPEERQLAITSTELVQEFRRMVGPIPGARELSYRAELGQRGQPIDIQLTGSNFDTLKVISEAIKERLREYPDVFDITDSFDQGKEEIRITMKPEAEFLNLSVAQLARQVRQAFFGEEAQRIQRNRDDVRVMVRYPFEDRRSIAHLEGMTIRAGDEREVPFSAVADLDLGQGLTRIRRVKGHRTINVTADVDQQSTSADALRRDLQGFLENLTAPHPDIRFSFEGMAREQQETFGSLGSGLVMVLFAIYAMLAIPFRSYLQPLIVMSVIPFGIVGAILGHLIMGMNLSIMSVFGLLALTGVVVNDSLVLVDYVNQRRREGLSLLSAVHTAGRARLRAILLTSLTTFAGLMPLIFEKSTQAQFLIPMAVSLGFGVLFATFITLLLIPVHYLILEDLRRAVSNLWSGWRQGRVSHPHHESAAGVQETIKKPSGN